MPYGTLALDAISTSGNLAVTGNVTASGNLTVSGTIASSTGTTYPLILATGQNTTSGTNIDFTGIPNWVRRVTIMFSGVSTNGTSFGQIQLGTSSGFVTSGYLSAAGFAVNAAGSVATNSTSGIVFGLGAADRVLHGHVILTLLGNNVWVASGAVGYSNAAAFGSCSGNITLSGTFDRIRITTVNGTDAFDAGSVNILYE